MAEPQQVIPFDRVPEGFARDLDAPDRKPAKPKPAATVVLARKGAGGMEVLLLHRTGSAGFVPGAFVFPGGRVDREDAGAAVLERTDHLSPEQAAERLALPSGAPPAVAYYLAAVRETFEETGLLIARDSEGRAAPGPGAEPRILELRKALLGGDVTFAQVLEELGLRIDGRSVEYIAHWITPKGEPRRFDTRFFAAGVPGNRQEIVAEGEITTSLWIEPDEALARSARGELPMVFPTLKTLEALLPFSSPSEILAHYDGRPIPSILPELVRTSTGVGIRLPRSAP